MINKYHTLYFVASPKPHIQRNEHPHQIKKDIQKTQEQIILSLIHLGTNLTISLRYIYDPNQSPQLKTYL
jgi:hypothetical protein